MNRSTTSIAVDNLKETMLRWYADGLGKFEDANLAGLKTEGARSRAEFLKAACLCPPKTLRLIDCKSTCQENQVVLIDWADEQVEYSAISHTYGMAVYDVFNCECTSKCFANVPRCSSKPCPQHLDPSDPRNKVVKDILGMCEILRVGGVEYAWHDGVCIAQHNSIEVDETIKHMGWIYAYARETIIFLHYVGSPMALIRHDGDLESRWQTRVWTFQEAAVSKCRRYCVRVGSTGLGDCQSLQELEEKISLWYRDDCSEVAIVEEEVLWKTIMEISRVLVHLLANVSASDHDTILLNKALNWFYCIRQWEETLFYSCFQFPNVATALEFCSLRYSKHEGDRINSVLALVGVKDFVAPKDDNIEASTVEFFKKQGQQGLARALFTTNLYFTINNIVQHRPSATPLVSSRHHTWVPNLSSPLRSIYESVKQYVDEVDGSVATTSSIENFIRFTVLRDGKLELTGQLACVRVKFTWRSGNASNDATESGTIVVLSVGPKNPLHLAMDLTSEVQDYTASLAQASMLELGTTVVQIIDREPESLITVVHGYETRASWRRRACECLRKATRAFCGLAATPPPSASNIDMMVHAVESQLISSGALARACSTMEPGWMAVVPNVSPTGVLAPLARAPSLVLGCALIPMLRNPTGQPVVDGDPIQYGQSFCAHLVFSLPALQHHQDYTASHEAPDWDYRVPALLVRGDLRTEVSKIGCFQLKQDLKDILLVLRSDLTIIPKLVII